MVERIQRLTPRRWLAFAAVAILCLSCGCGDRPVRVRRVLVDVEPGAAGVGVEREAVRGALDKLLGQTPGLKLVDGDDGAILRARVSAAEATPGTNPPRATVAVVVELTGDRTGGAALVTRGRSILTLNGKLTGQQLRSGLDDALGQVLLVQSAGDLSSAELAAWLRDKDATPDQKARAVRVLGGRGDLSASPVLVEAIRDAEQEGDEERALAAVRALSSLWSAERRALDAPTPAAARDATAAIISFAERRAPTVIRVCVDAAAAIGGREAAAWIFTLSSGHPDGDVQSAAANALQTLESGAASTAPAVAVQAAPPSPSAAPTRTQ